METESCVARTDTEREQAATAQIFTIRLERPDGSWTFEAPSDEYLLYTLIDAGIETPFICEQGWCLACAAKLVSGKVDDSAALTRYPEDGQAGFLLLCSARPLSDLVLRQDIHETRREMTQHRIGLNQLARAYPPGKRAGFRRGRRRTATPAE
ncbi:ferredoxin [Rhizobium aquaticum]|uniref:Ferredoxin n=1 Tax=Rhizobium aquaticum TaxID=1549636 RepID=A0ABV2J4C4_9HYPH